MKRSVFKRLSLFISVLTLAAAPFAFAQTDPGAVDLSTRQGARTWFNQWWPISHSAPMGFTGNVSTGNAGDTSQAFKDNVALRINIFRRMAGLQPIVFNSAYNAEDQIIAMMMSANNGISHNPPTSWNFYSTIGADAASKSLLALDEAGPAAIAGYMYDWGPDNGEAGHRNFGLLFPATTTMGTGDVPTVGSNPAANAIWNNDPSSANAPANHAVPLLLWPANGYVPNFLIPGRWTVYIPDLSDSAPCDLSHTTVSVTQDGKALSLHQGADANGSTLVWTLDGTAEGDSDTLFATFTYQGELFGWARPNFQNDIHYHIALDGIRVPHFDANFNELGDGPLYTGAPGVVNGHYEYDVFGYDPDIEAVVPGQEANLINISTRSFAGDGSSTQIAGFIISGTAPRKVLIRAGGPYLSQFGVTNVLPDPVLTLYDGSNAIQSNDDWGADAVDVTAATTAVGATPFALGSTDAAIVTTLQPGHAYTAHVIGKNGATGNAIVEVYDADAGTASNLINISTRSFVGTGASIQIGGFILRGPGPRKVLVRAGGAYLTQFGVTGVLPDPVLIVFKGQTQIATNDDWGSDAADVTAATQSAGAVQFASGSTDSALVLTLDPNQAYTAQVAGKNGATGNALIEIYQLP